MLPPWLTSRVLLVVVTTAFSSARRLSPLTLWNVLDAQWYTGIAAHGYGWSLDGKPSLAFFPLYPLAIHVAGSTGRPFIAVALLLSNVAALAALLYLRALFSLVWGASAARRGLWIFSLFPTAFFTFAPYSEPLFILCAAAGLYHSYRAQWLPTGLWLAAALLTRSTAVILLAPVLMMVLGAPRRAMVLAVGPGVCALAGYLSYLLIMRLPVQQLVEAQRHWHRALTLPWNGFAASVHYLLFHFTYNAGWSAENLLQLGFTVVFLGLTLAAWRDLPPPVVLYCAAFWVVVLCTPEWLDGYFAPFSSVDRFILALFPLAGWAGARLTVSRLRVWLPLSASLMAGGAAVHLSGGWIG
ncbi:MAG TPA: mannosyltransferase family protein [Chloroflexota bacterium]